MSETVSEAPAEEKKVESVQDRNFSQMRKVLEEERREREKLQARLEEIQQEQEKRHAVRSQAEEDEDDDEPYVDRRRLKKEMGRFSEKTSEIATERAYKKIREELEDEKRQTWLENTPDFEDVLQFAEEFSKKAPNTAKEILTKATPFEKQRAAYYAIKEMGLHKKPDPSIQEKIDNNKKSAFYSPAAGQGAPYGGAGFDSSKETQKRAYDQVQALKARLRGG